MSKGLPTLVKSPLCLDNAKIITMIKIEVKVQVKINIKPDISMV